jgi:hypothetical protein
LTADFARDQPGQSMPGVATKAALAAGEHS